jgi:DnaK suppressor protein
MNKSKFSSQGITQEIVLQCKTKLLSLKTDLLNQSKQLRSELLQNDAASGDEVDQAVAHLTEHSFLVAQDRIRNRLFEIEQALARIEGGQFGLCEETQEPIEIERLLAIPYTRLSIEGAEIRESMNRRYLRG